jgi:enolase-phosphatase E1
MPIRAILTDIEGTTSSIHFVHQVLFPYSSAALPAFVRAHHTQPQVAKALAQVAAETGVSVLNLDAIIQTLLAWIAKDNKHSALKTLQGLIWAEGYQQAAFKAHVYPEVAQALARWQAQGLLLYVYSSGSVAAQKLLFGHSEAGDLRPFFSDYFDTQVGPKRASESYRAIARRIGLIASEVLFLSDIVEELDAAADTGMRTVQLLRAGDDVQANVQTRHPIATHFDEIRL